MNNNLELIYWTSNGGVELPLEDWQYKVIAQVLGLSVQEDESGNITFSHFPKDFVMKRIEKNGGTHTSRRKRKNIKHIHLMGICYEYKETDTKQQKED